jgi:hypothetical protein
MLAFTRIFRLKMVGFSCRNALFRQPTNVERFMWTNCETIFDVDKTSACAGRSVEEGGSAVQGLWLWHLGHWVHHFKPRKVTFSWLWRCTCSFSSRFNRWSWLRGALMDKYVDDLYIEYSCFSFSNSIDWPKLCKIWGQKTRSLRDVYGHLGFEPWHVTPVQPCRELKRNAF